MRPMILLAAALAAGPALATDEEILSLYEENGRAWAEGRLDEADAAGEAAWRMAEAEWGASEDTALLAEGLTQQRLLTGRRDAAREPAARVAALVSEGVAPGIHPAQAGLYVALAEFDPAAAQPADIEMLESALAAVESAQLPVAAYNWIAWLDLTRAHSAAEDWENAYAAGENVMNVMDLTAGVPDAARVEAAILSGAAAAEDREFGLATQAFAWARQYIPQTVTTDGEETLNPDWALVGAYELLTNAARFTLRQDEVAPAADVFGLDEMDASVVCPAVEWETRPPPSYPDAAQERGLVGAAVVEYEVGADGRTTQERVAAEAPMAGFGISLRSVRSWRADPDTIGDCVGRKLVVHFEYGF